jgi:RsiW-degrading membrane proteinase PrsW (M82 family)
MEATLVLKIAIALLPAPIMLGYFAIRDVFKLMSMREVALLLFLGAVAGVIAFPISGQLIDALPLGFSFYSRFVAPWIEEVLKATAIVGLFWFNRIGLKLDAAISGFAVGVGFSLVENSLYLLNFSGYNIGVWLVRGLGAAVMHGGATAMFAVVAHELGERRTRGLAAEWRFVPLEYIPGLLLAVFVHTVFNQFPDRPLLAMVGAFLLVPATNALVFRWGEVEGRDWLASDMEAHKAQLEALRRNGYRSPEAGPLRDALDRRMRGRVSEAVLGEYVELHTELVLRAEQLLHARTTGQSFEISEGDRAGLARLAELKRELGKPMVKMLARWLPFSRNDLWELREFEEDARRP